MRTPILTLAAAVVVATACGSDSTAPASKIVNLTTTLSPANEPAVTGSPTSSGTFTATLDTSTNVFTYDLTFTGLTAGAVAGHIHGPAAVGVNAGTTIDFKSLPGATFSSGLTAGTGHGVATLNAATAITTTVSGDSLKKLLFAGLTYANIHTSNNTGGEIRGQITKQ